MSQKVSVSKKRIKNVWDGVQKNMEEGKAPNVSGEMRKAGYSEKSCKSLEVTKTQVWKMLLDQVDDQELMDVYTDCLRDPKDKKLRMAAADRLAKFKGYDKTANVSLTFHKKLEDLYEE